MRWQLQGVMKEARGWQDDETGKPLAYVKIDFMGGCATAMIDPTRVTEFGKYQGKKVQAAGDLAQRKDGAFRIGTLDTINEVK